jgi:hypothetical protein
MPRRPPIPEERRENLIYVRGSYEAALRESCKLEVSDPLDWLTASADAASFAEYEREVAVLAGLAFDERFGEPVEVMWYSLPTPLPPMWRGPAAPRQFRVIPGDLVEPLSNA